MENSKIRTGSAFPLGALRQKGGFNFAIYSENPVLELVVAPFDCPDDIVRIPLDPQIHRTGCVWHIFYETDHTVIYYAYKVLYEGKNVLAIDPYAKLIDSRNTFGNNCWQEGTYKTKPLGIAFLHAVYDWESDRPARVDSKDLIVYEMHVRGFTEHVSSNTQYPGTYRGVIDKIPYLQDLGVTAVEFLPLHEFNEADNYRKNTKTGEPLCNFWGYATLNFFCPMMRYSTSDNPIEALHEFKDMVKALHKAGISVIVDVVFNHTGEGNEQGPVMSFKAFAESTYYLKNEQNYFLNYTGCGNTVNCNHPIVQDMIIDSLRYWATELHIDAFRFDLASILTRGQDGSVLKTAPLIERITQDPVLSHCALIAEPWDAAGLHQVGYFYQSHFEGPECWLEWNDDFRSVIRNFIKGTPNYAGRFATKICGSQDIYGHSGRPINSINFVTCHDGFSLRDVVSYNEKHNDENGEYNQDGMNNNDSWNCGHEGPTDTPKIVHLRHKQMKNFCLALMCSAGVPMFVMGDEYGHTKNGNNNTWCLDTKQNWLLWDEMQQSSELYRFWKKLIHFRKSTSYFRRARFFHGEEITWHGPQPNKPDWDAKSQFVAFSLDDLYIAFNASPSQKLITLPGPHAWRLVIDTHAESPNDFPDEQKGQACSLKKIKIAPYSALMLQSE